MDREISSGAMLGIVLLALAAVISLGFGVFGITKGVANEGTVSVQDSLGSVSAQVFLDYDQKVVTGNQVVGALKNFEGKPYAVLIHTKAMARNQLIASATDRPAGAYFVSDGKLEDEDYVRGDYVFLNYNALLAKDASGVLPADGPNAVFVAGGKKSPAVFTNDEDDTLNNIPAVRGAVITFSNGSYTAPFGFATEDGSVMYDLATGGVFKSGNAEYIPSGTKYQANLLKDNSGAIMGIVFRQL